MGVNQSTYRRLSEPQSATNWQRASRSLVLIAISIAAIGCDADINTPVPVCSAANASAVFTGETVKDSTLVEPGTEFEQSWTIENRATDCSWDQTFALVYVRSSQSRLSIGGDTIPVRAIVRPGGEYSFTMRMRAPTQPGTYREEWRLIDRNGTTIKVGNSTTVWVIIRVA